ncbi:uncharacterized protein [Chelonus insularis]|uniref:uncharacterized protein n=1 Tax=Chelonus insularis TaxID=460826 RepID=UPI00158C2B34|nr:uncharacterized protein LOC118069127 [Chelonus insularis]
MCRRVIHRFKKTLTIPFTSTITPEKRDDAIKYWVRVTQQYKFMTELSLLRRSIALTKSHPLVKLLPFIDNQRLLRIGGQLRNSLLPMNSKHPYILPANSRLSLLIIRDAHEQTLHGSTQKTLAFIRQTFWIIGGRSPIRSFIRKCPRCIRYRAQAASHIMGQLPTSRVTPGRAFLHTGIDYAGPFIVKTWRGRAAKTYKAWVSLFICMSTSAIHLKLVTDYSTEAFIAAYKRFTARRGICATLSSDCGTNFKGADAHLRQFFDQQSKELNQISSILSNSGTKWIFNPPSSPHFGGKWEAGVKSMKYHLPRIVGDTQLTYEELSTVLCQIEGILNSRPLCPLTDDPNDLEVLTPGHFLVGHSLNLIPEPNVQYLKTSRLSRWQHLCYMTQSFWEKWSKEYLQRFSATYKWKQATPTIQEGSPIIITDERYPPAKWALGRVLKLHHGSDGVARVATIKTSTSTLTRPLVKLCPLDITSESCSSPEPTKAGGNV